ncbi:helix-turn-helix domain-containing protein [Novosphingobium sp. ERN07]|uniref:helix-turn-helix domain-containing protein n=1 Tax=Novosphingobium sp. ERN07 TaxID=2726187 RepID=UPI001F0DB85F|nr:helix-turn-helix transcriptional regulator [Novosphingobium sp. ERN07]
MSLIVGGLIGDIACLTLSMDGIQQRLAKNLARLRREAGMSQEAFADHAGIHRTYISDLERAARNPTISIVERLARALKVKPGDLLD